MKILAVFCGIGGLAGLSGVIYAEDFGSGALSFIMGSLLFFLAYKLWNKKRKPKEPYYPGEASFLAELEKRKGIEQPPMNPYVDMGKFQGTAMLEPMIYPDLFLKANEQVYYAIPAKLTDFYDGIPQTRAIGDYVVTNQRALFLADEDAWEIPLQYITAVRTDHFRSFTLITKSRSYNVTVGDIMYGNPQLEAEYSRLATMQIMQRFLIG